MKPNATVSFTRNDETRTFKKLPDSLAFLMCHVAIGLGYTAVMHLHTYTDELAWFSLHSYDINQVKHTQSLLCWPNNISSLVRFVMKIAGYKYSGYARI